MSMLCPHGKELGKYESGRLALAPGTPVCDPGPSRVAVWKVRVYWLQSTGAPARLDAATAEGLGVDTIADHKLPYSSTGAPQSLGVSWVGNICADMTMAAVRVYVSAYDVVTAPSVALHKRSPPIRQAVRESLARHGRQNLGFNPHRQYQRLRTGVGTASPTFLLELDCHFGTANALRISRQLWRRT